MANTLSIQEKNELTLSVIFQRFTGKILFTLGLLSLENILMIAMPFLLGLAIDGLLAGDKQPLYLLAAVLILSTILGTARRFYDTRVYSHIAARLAREVAEKQLARQSSVSKVNTRVEMVSELVDFFEYELVESFNAVIKLVGTLVMLGFFHINLLLTALACTAFIVVIYLISGTRYFNLNRALNDQHEQQVDILTAGQRPSLFRHFTAMARSKVRLSDIEALNFGGVFILISLLIVINLVLASEVVGITTGGLFSVLTYTWEFAEVAIVLPLVYQQWVRSKEISTRLEH